LNSKISVDKIYIFCVGLSAVIERIVLSELKGLKSGGLKVIATLKISSVSVGSLPVAVH
jgi:hypothetical protein